MARPPGKEAARCSGKPVRFLGARDCPGLRVLPRVTVCVSASQPVSVCPRERACPRAAPAGSTEPRAGAWRLGEDQPLSWGAKRCSRAVLPQEQKFCQRYDQLMEAWEKKVERIESNPRRRAKESKVREYYEKQFPEIRKQRELQERMQR